MPLDKVQKFIYLSWIDADEVRQVLKMKVLSTFLKRLIGLLGTSAPASTPALIIPCSSIHAFGMKYDLDIAFINSKGEVIKVRKGLKPNKIVSSKGAWCVIERATTDKPWPVAGNKIEFNIKPHGLPPTAKYNSAINHMERSCAKSEFERR